MNTTGPVQGGVGCVIRELFCYQKKLNKLIN
jgi:hypothetical protein